MNKRFKQLILADTFWYFLNGLIAPFLTIYFNEFGSFEEIGLSVAIFYLVQGLISIIAGKVLSLIKARHVLFITQIMEGIRILFFIIAKDIYWVYIIQFVGGLTTGFISPAYDKLFVKVGIEEKGKSFGSRSAIISISLGISAVISGFMINLYGFAPVLLIWSITEIVYGILLFRV